MEKIDRSKMEETMEARCRTVEEKAQRLFDKGVPWTTFFKELLGPEGLIRQLFRTPEELSEFEQTATHRKVQEMLASLRRAQEGRAAKTEAISVITLRIPKSLHDALAEEAHALKTSINRLCISKLAQLIDARLVPPLRQFERRTESSESHRGLDETVTVDPSRAKISSPQAASAWEDAPRT